MNYEKIILKSGRERSLLNRHPWVFSGGVKQMPKAPNGSIVEVRTNADELLGYGFFAPNSQIMCRLFEFTSEPIEINANYWKNKITRAFDYRKQFINNDQTNIYRLIHAEGDFFPGIIIDIYNHAAVCQILVKGVELISQYVFEALNSLGFNHIYLKTKQSTQLLENVTDGNRWVNDAILTMPINAKEYNIQFNIDVEKGQKTGFFIDQRENRRMLGELSMGKTVLNTFSYSGGFSLSALKYGATWVDSVDSSKDAVELANQNVALNGFSNHEGIVADCFEYLKQCQKTYDIIVLDPPAFAKHSRAVANASRGYQSLNKLGIEKVKPGGLIFTFSCSQHIDKDLFRKIVFSAAAECKRNVRIVRQLSQPDDHPINIYHPEGEYLKGLLLHVE